MGISDKHSAGLPLANSGMQNQSGNKKGDLNSFQSYKEIIQEWVEHRKYIAFLPFLIIPLPSPSLFLFLQMSLSLRDPDWP